MKSHDVRRDRNGLRAGDEWDATTLALHDAEAKRPTLVHLPPVQHIEIVLQGVSYFVPSSSGAPCSRKSRHTQLLNNIDCQFRSGELVALMSSSGAGKSTLLNLLAMRSPRDARIEVRYASEWHCKMALTPFRVACSSTASPSREISSSSHR